MILSQVNEPGLVLPRFEDKGQILTSLNIHLILKTWIRQSYEPPKWCPKILKFCKKNQLSISWYEMCFFPPIKPISKVLVWETRAALYFSLICTLRLGQTNNNNKTSHKPEKEPKIQWASKIGTPRLGNNFLIWFKWWIIWIPDLCSDDSVGLVVFICKHIFINWKPNYCLVLKQSKLFTWWCYLATIIS